MALLMRSGGMEKIQVLSYFFITASEMTKMRNEGAHYVVVTVEFRKELWWATVEMMYMAHYRKSQCSRPTKCQEIL